MEGSERRYVVEIEIEMYLEPTGYWKREFHFISWNSGNEGIR